MITLTFFVKSQYNFNKYEEFASPVLSVLNYDLTDGGLVTPYYDIDLGQYHPR